VVGASHGGVYAAWLAAVARVRGLIVSDAGVGRERAGIAGLAYLDGLGIAAAAVDHDSARIGDGADLMARGRISHVNTAASALGAMPVVGTAQHPAKNNPVNLRLLRLRNQFLWLVDSQTDV